MYVQSCNCITCLGSIRPKLVLKIKYIRDKGCQVVCRLARLVFGLVLRSYTAPCYTMPEMMLTLSPFQCSTTASLDTMHVVRHWLSITCLHFPTLLSVIHSIPHSITPKGNPRAPVSYLLVCVFARAVIRFDFHSLYCLHYLLCKFYVVMISCAGIATVHQVISAL